ncbi:hypothetical protein ABPG77_005752 [Micractinium sp. CCAP 211/92]
MARNERCFSAVRLLRRCSTTANSEKDTLGRWLKEWVAVPQVVAPEGTEPPTALSWLRRRGPALPESALHKLFRQQTVRVYDPATQRVGRVSKGRQLAPGATLLLPRAAVAAAASGREGAAPPGSDAASGGAGSAGSRGRALAGQQVQAWLAQLRSSLLHQEADFLAINKPAGLACQGGTGLALSLDCLMGEAFRDVPGVLASQLRLVHRLDKQTTGALLLAQNPDAAAWLAAAFKQGSLDGAGSSSSSSSGAAGRKAAHAAQPASIRKTYWAVVARGEEGEPGAALRTPGQLGGGRGWLPRSGCVRLAVPSSKETGEALPAETRYRVLHQGSHLAWLELRPSTGRKHQLRLHCAHGLGAPILGDSRYGQVRSGAQAAALATVQQAGGGAAAGRSEPPLFLHCRQLLVRRPGGRQAAVQVTAPLPAPWCALLEQQGWPLPPERSARPAAA